MVFGGHTVPGVPSVMTDDCFLIEPIHGVLCSEQTGQLFTPYANRSIIHTTPTHPMRCM